MGIQILIHGTGMGIDQWEWEGMGYWLCYRTPLVQSKLVMMMMMMMMMDCFTMPTVVCQAVRRRDRDAVRSDSTQSALGASQHPRHHRSAARQVTAPHVTQHSCSSSLSPISSSIAHSVFYSRLETGHFHKSFPYVRLPPPPTRRTYFPDPLTIW